MTVTNPFVLLSFLITSGLLFLCISHVDVDARSSMSSVIGIHLGNMYSSVSVYKHPEADNMLRCPRGMIHYIYKCRALTINETIEAVVNEQGSITTPSCVSFTDSGGVLVGEAAKEQEAVRPQRTVCGINRLIGRRFDNPELQSYINTLPYKVVEKDNEPYVEVEFNDGEVKLFSPEEICAMILGKMKEMAEKYMGTESSLAVILIHESYYDKEVREGIYRAWNMVDINVPFVGVGHSICALELANDLGWGNEDFKALIFHLGGSAFMTTIVKNKYMEMIATRKDLNFGGRMFDTRLVDYFVGLIKNKYEKDISNDSNALRELKVECERAKILLSEIDRVMINVEFRLADGQMLVIEEALTRETFEELNMDLFNRSIDMVKSMFEQGKINTTDIDEIILLGRSTQIPMIQHLIKSYIGKEPLSNVKPKDALLFAATANAGHIASHIDNTDMKVGLNPTTIGIEEIGAIMARFLEGQNSLIPGTMTRNVTTSYDGQTTMVIKVFEGERKLTKNCHYLGNLQLSNLPPAPRGVTKVEVTVDLHEDGEIVVTAEHKPTQNKESITIPKEERNSNLLTMEQIIQEVKQVEENHDQDLDALDNIYTFYYSFYHPQPRTMGFAVKKIIS